MSNQTLKALEKRLGHSFGDPALLERALSHSSLSRASYERLEFLGDRVLGLIVADMLYRQFPHEPEGALAKRHAALVRRETLAEVAGRLGLAEAIAMTPSEDEAGGRGNPAILADVCEAILAAIYLDGGLEQARLLVEREWQSLLEADLKPPQDAKTALQEKAQGRGLALPSYREIGRSGPDHSPEFEVEVEVKGMGRAVGSGRSKRLAEKAAAEALLEQVK